MVATKLDKYLNVKDKNNIVVSSWAVAYKAGVAKCSHCKCEVSFKTGKSALTHHSESSKHTNKAPRSDTATYQLSITESLSNSLQESKREEKLEDKAKEFEISLARSLSNHNISMDFLDCIQEQLQKYCGDSEVVTRMKLHRRKGEVMLRHGIAKTYQDETVLLLSNCDAFSVGFDESEVNKKSQLEIMIKVATKSNGIELRHYRTLDLVDTTAAKIVEALIEQFDEDGVDYQKKLITTMTDGCNTMQGWKTGVKKRLSDKIPQFVDLGSCNDHHLSNALKHGVTAFDADIQQALVNIYMDVGGAKGKGLKKKKEFEAVCENIGLKPRPLKKFCTTRFRSIRDCMIPVLHNWNGIVKYYSQVKKPTDRQKLLKAYFVDREWMSLLKMKFVNASARELIEGIDYFEKRASLLHNAREKMEKILRSQILKLHDETAVNEADDDIIETICKKSGPKLLEVDVDDKRTRLNKRSVFVGQEATSLIKSLSLDPKSPQLAKFYESVYVFHRTVILKLMTYFGVGLKSTELEYMSAFSPRKFNAMSTGHQMKYLAKKFSKVVENIHPTSGFDRIVEEIEQYTVDDDVKLITSKLFEEYWQDVSKLTEGDGEWVKYNVLSRFALALGTAFNSNSEAERAFSVQTDIHRNPKRNLMLQETFDAHMQVHYGVEGKSSREVCPKCIQYKASDSKPPHHCHCCIAKIGEDMKEDCKKKWSADRNRQELAKVEDSKAEEKAKVANKETTRRKLTFANSLKTRQNFFPPELMTPVYAKVNSESVVTPQPPSKNTKQNKEVEIVIGSPQVQSTKKKKSDVVMPQPPAKKTKSKQ